MYMKYLIEVDSQIQTTPKLGKRKLYKQILEMGFLKLVEARKPSETFCTYLRM